MLSFPGSLKIFLAIEAIDLRSSFNGLYGLVEGALKEDPRSGALFAFTNQRHSRLKMLYWDGTGMWVMTKRLEKGTFSWPTGVAIENGKLSLSPEALGLLMDGVDLRGAAMRPWYQR